MGSTTVQAPPPLDPTKVGTESLQTQIALAPEQFRAESQYAPQYAQLYANIMRNTLLGTESQPGLLSTYSQAAPSISDLQAKLNTAQRQANINDVTNLGAQATQAFNQANPQLMALQNQISQNALNPKDVVSQLGKPQQLTAGQISAGDNPLLGQLNQSVAAQLAQGGQLSPYEQAQAVNATQSQMSLYGRQNDPIAAANAALNLDSVSRQRLQQAQAAASSVAGQNQAANALGLQAQAQNQAANLQAGQLNNQFDLQYGAANQQAQLQNANFNANQLMGGFGALAQTAQNPYALILGQSGGVGQLQGLTGQAGSFNTSTQNFNPFNQAITGIYAGNQANQLAANTATANNTASIIGGGLSGLGALGGGLFSGAGAAKGFGALFGCWVAREVYGNHDSRWWQFRHWLYNFAPRWFVKLYETYGERFAAFISNKPRIKSAIRWWMDGRIASLKGAV